MMSNKSLMIVMLFTLLTFAAEAQINNCGDADKFPKLNCQKKYLNLIDENNPIEIRIYTKANLNYQNNRTFVVVHNNEEKGLYAVKEVLSEPGFGGRLIEVVSNYDASFDNFKDKGNEKRYLYFGNGKYCVDPNRVYTKRGRDKALNEVREERKDKNKNKLSPICEGTPDDPDTIGKLEKFADGLINIVKDVKKSADPTKYKFIIGVHNNTEPGALEITSWLQGGSEAKTAAGIVGSNYHNNSKGLTKDDFILVSNMNLFKLFFDTSNPFTYSIALQEAKSYLTDSNGNIKEEFDDGSMSLYFGTKNFAPNIPFSYINIEAGGKENPKDSLNDSSKKWQKEIVKKAIKIKV